MDYALGILMSAMAGAGLIAVGDAELYNNPKVFFGLV